MKKINVFLGLFILAFGSNGNCTNKLPSHIVDDHDHDHGDRHHDDNDDRHHDDDDNRRHDDDDDGDYDDDDDRHWYNW